MRHARNLFMIVSFVGTLLGMNPEAWGGGNVTPPSCLVNVNQTVGSTFTGTVVVATENYDGSFADLDVTLRLTYKGQEDVFRAHMTHVSILSPEDLACRILAAQPLDANLHTITTAFGASGNLVITNRSISGSNWHQVPFGAGGSATIWTGIADINIYTQ